MNTFLTSLSLIRLIRSPITSPSSIGDEVNQIIPVNAGAFENVAFRLSTIAVYNFVLTSVKFSAAILGDGIFASSKHPNIKSVPVITFTVEPAFNSMLLVI